MKVLKVETEAFTASFRYPRVQVGRLPTFDMPPPATIYGHIAGALGEWFDPKGLDFAYTFTSAGKAVDLETGQPIERGPGKNSLRKQGWDFPVNVICSPNPQRREFLLRPRLTLYLRGSEDVLERLGNAFLNPEFASVLGRSQDLAMCRAVTMMEARESPDVFFSHTLLPYDWRPWVLPGVSVLMPAFINYAANREALNSRYLQITWPPLRLFSDSTDTISRERLPEAFVADDSETREFSGRALPRGLCFHSLGPESAA